MEMQIDDTDLKDLVEEVLTAVDSVVMDGLSHMESAPEILYAATILHEFGINYFGEDDAWLYALAPDALHPSPWTWLTDSYVLGTWKVHDGNNVMVGRNLSDEIRNELPKYWSTISDMDDEGELAHA
tara:strand:- start:16430 stop:16810 length:381 start_codon:yes stop_codon:yes gene_type:complete